jgi:isocitrate dehydrogenase
MTLGHAGIPNARDPSAPDGPLDLHAGVRPIKLYAGVPSPLALPAGRTIDYVIFRENTEGLLASRGGASVGREVATDTLVVTRAGTERIARRAFETAMRRRRRLTSVDKANVFRSYAVFRRLSRRSARIGSTRRSIARAPRAPFARPISAAAQPPRKRATPSLSNCEDSR